MSSPYQFVMDLARIVFRRWAAEGRSTASWVRAQATRSPRSAHPPIPHGARLARRTEPGYGLPLMRAWLRFAWVLTAAGCQSLSASGDLFLRGSDGGAGAEAASPT